MQVKAKSQDNGAGPDLHIECRSGSRRENESGSMLMPDAKFGIRFLSDSWIRNVWIAKDSFVWEKFSLNSDPKKKKPYLSWKGWTVLCFSHLLFWADSWIPFWEGHFLMHKPEFVAFFELGIWCLLCFLSMNYSLIFKGCWKLFHREKNPDLVVFRRFKSGLSVLHFNLCWYWSDFRFNALWESHQIRVTWSAKTQLSLNPDSQRKEIARWPGTGSRFRLFESHIFLGEMFFLYTVGMIFWSWLLGLSWRALSLPLNSDPDSIPSPSIELLSIRLRLGIFSDWILKISRKLFLW